MGRRKPRQQAASRRSQLASAIDQTEKSLRQQFQQLCSRRQVDSCLLYDQDPKQQLKYVQTHNYYQDFWNTFLINEVMMKQVKKLLQDVRQLDQGVKSIESLQNQQSQLVKERTKKKHRRLAAEIGKTHQCPYGGCFKAYGSDVSLNLHIKIKHNGGTKTERQEQAKRILEATEKGLPTPNSALVFPPGYLEECRRKWKQL